MTFDPFGDFETRGYLRNFVGEKDSEIVRRLEHTSFTTGIDSAFDRLAAKIAQAPGLGGNSRQNEVLGKTNDPALQARYEQQELKRKRK